MGHMLSGLFRPGQGPDLGATAFSLLLAYVLAQVIAAAYAWSIKGRKANRSMVQALVVAGIVAATLMLAIGNSLARGIGIVGTLALIRFRTNLRDPLDMVFVFAAFGAGIASGTQSHTTSIVGTALFVLVITVMKLSGFGAAAGAEGTITLKVPRDSGGSASIETVLGQTCASFSLLALREGAQGKTIECEYRVALKREVGEPAFMNALRQVPGVRGLAFDVGNANEGTV